MKQPPVLIKQIYQKDNEVFVIEWSDSIVSEYRLSHLQQNCPCAQCYNPITGTRLSTAPNFDKGVRAVKLTNVGRYALRILFNSGCSKGIYSFALLRQLAKEKINV